MKTVQKDCSVGLVASQDEARAERIRAAIRAADQEKEQGLAGLSVDEVMDSVKDHIREIYRQENA